MGGQTLIPKTSGPAVFWFSSLKIKNTEAEKSSQELANGVHVRDKTTPIAGLKSKSFSWNALFI